MFLYYGEILKMEEGGRGKTEEVAMHISLWALKYFLKGFQALDLIVFLKTM